MKIVLLNSKADLLKYRDDIENLFYQSFGSRVLGDLWDWAYINNPGGDPIVTLAFDNKELVGHYAIVPMPLIKSGVRWNSYISMTTMVAESHRKLGLFSQLAAETYLKAKVIGVDFVFGFPNAQSTPGFRKRLNWILPEPDYVATVTKVDLLKYADTGGLDKSNYFSFNLQDPLTRAWRLSRPGACYTFAEGVVYKRYGNEIDLLWWEHPSQLINLPDDLPINVLLKAGSGFEKSKKFEYQFGGIGLRCAFDHSEVFREMIMSDIF